MQASVIPVSYTHLDVYKRQVQEMADFVGLAFELAFKYRNPAIILADGVIGQMMEKVVLPEMCIRDRLYAEQGTLLIIITDYRLRTTNYTYHKRN